MWSFGAYTRVCVVPPNSATSRCESLQCCFVPPCRAIALGGTVTFAGAEYDLHYYGIRE